MPVSVWLVLHVSFTADQTAVLREEIERIWTPYGIDVKWNAPDPVMIVIDGPATALPVSDIEHRWPLASIRFIDGRPTPSIHVSIDAISQVVARARHPYALSLLRPRMTARAAGRVIAHELGHYLLTSREYSRSGLMQAVFSPDTLVDPFDEQPLGLEPLFVARLHGLGINSRETVRCVEAVDHGLRLSRGVGNRTTAPWLACTCALDKRAVVAHSCD